MGDDESSLMMASAAGSSSSTATESSTDTDTDAALRTPTRGRISGPTRRSTKGGWTTEEDANLVIKVQLYRGKNWKKIAESFPGRSDVQCLHRWQKVLNPDLVKGPWTKEEDDHILKQVKIFGPKKWSLIAKSLPGRIGKQCRERWHNHLNPSIKKDAWTEAEEILLIRAHQIYGNKWAEIARFLPGRADNSIKNHWNCSVKKKLSSYEASGLLCPVPAFSTPENFLPSKEMQNVDVESVKQDEGIVSVNDEAGQGDGTDVAPVSLVGTNGNDVGQLFNVKLEDGSSLDGFQNTINAGIEEFRKSASDLRSVTHGNATEASHTPSTVLTLSTSMSPSEMTTEQRAISHLQTLHPVKQLAQAKDNTLGQTEDKMDQMVAKETKENTLGQTEDKMDQMVAKETKENKDGMVRSSCSDASFTISALATNNKIMEPTEDTAGKAVVMETKENKASDKVRSSCSDVPVDGRKSSMLVSGRPLPLDEACNLKIIDDQSVSASSLESHTQLVKSPICSTPDSCKSRSTAGARGVSSPVSFLRNAARTFRNTPSILRKRSRVDYSHENTVGKIQHTGYCNPEGSSHVSKVPRPTSTVIDSEHKGHHLVSSLSSSSSKPEAAAVPERVEKCLESVFDKEWDKASAKCV